MCFSLDGAKDDNFVKSELGTKVGSFLDFEGDRET